jgi:hypothetical protein
MLEVRHNDAMKKVEELAEEPSFVYNSKGQTTETYILNKKQAIAVGGYRV